MKIYAATPDTKRSQTQIDLATEILKTYAATDFSLLHELVLTGKPEQFARLFQEYEAFRQEAIKQLREDLAQAFVHDANKSAEEMEQSRLNWIARQANAAVALMRLEDPSPVYQFLTVEGDPEALSQFIYRIRGREVSPSLLMKSFRELAKLPTPAEPRERWQHVLRLYGMTLGLGEFTVDQLPSTDREDFIELVSDMYGEHPSRAVHSALGWLLRRWGQVDRVQAVDEEPLEYDASGEREWYVIQVKPPRFGITGKKSMKRTDEGIAQIDLTSPICFTMLVFQGGEFEMGEGAGRTMVEIPGPLAVSDREVTWKQFSPVDRDSHRQTWETQESFQSILRGRRLLPEEPAFGVSWLDAVNYCRWLTEARMPGEENQCYAKRDFTWEQSGEMGWLHLPDPKDWEWPMDPKRPGFRLLTEKEWEYVARGGMKTPYSFGTSEELLREYGWYDKIAGGWSQQTGVLRPSISGLFDIHGNLWEWTDSWHDKGTLRVVRGGSWIDSAVVCTSTSRYSDAPTGRSSSYGFRLAVSLSGHSGLAEPTAVKAE
jgi:formylglycine-generating enzyme required for sulfatase activity